MSSLSRRAWLATAAAAGLGAGVLVRRGESSATPARDAIRARYFPNVVLRTHEGREVRFYDDLIKNRIVVINFMYARCGDGTCPITTANLVQVQKLLGERVGRDIFMYSITLTPTHDTPAVLKAYAKTYGVGPGWEFLTGKPNDIELLRRKLGFTDPDPARDANRANHIGTLRYGNEPLQLWAACPGMANPAWIVKSISWVDPNGPGCSTCSGAPRKELG
jgi:protein SCO1/2